MDSVGFPEIPVISYLVAIPSCDSVILNLTLLDSLRFSDVNIYPAPELVPDTLTGGTIALVEEFSYDSAAYSTDDWLPGTVAETIDKGAIRDQHVIRVLYFPVSDTVWFRRQEPAMIDQPRLEPRLNGGNIE
jgi:hypothetical protein